MGTSGRTGPPAIRGDWYDHPSWYDILHAPGTAEESTILERIAMRSVRSHSNKGRAVSVLEPACGTGRYLRVLAGRGYEVAGFDSNPRMIGYARDTFGRRRLKGQLFAGDMTRFRISSKADFAFCTFSTIRHLPSDSSVLAHLACIARSLRRGGVYIVGLDIAPVNGEKASRDVWKGGRGLCHVRQIVRYEPPAGRSRLERVTSDMVVTTPSRCLRLETRYDLRTYTRAQWIRLIERSALAIESACDLWGEDLGSDAGLTNGGGYRMFVLRPRA